MKRKGNLYGQIMSLDNLRLADQRAMKGKPNQPGVIEHKKHIEEDLQKLHVMFSNKTYRTSAYYRKTIREPKEREISILSYFPNRIAHHAVMNILEPVLVPCFIAQTYSCIKGRGKMCKLH